MVVGVRGLRGRINKKKYELSVALRSREVRGGMGVWISLPEVCVRCSNCHAIVAGSGSEGALRVRGNESEAPSQQGKPGKRGRMRRKNTLVQSKISAVNVPVSLRRSGIFTLFGGIFTLPGGNFTLPGGVFTLPGGFFSLPGGIFALPGGMFACLAEFCPVWWVFRLVWWGFCFLPGLVGF